MPDERQLGRLVSVHGIDPAALQRGVFIVILSFLFFLGTMFLYYIRQGIGYFLLATAFLVTYLVTLFSWVMLRRNAVRIHEFGFAYRRKTALWSEIESVSPTGIVELKNGRTIALPGSLHHRDKVLDAIRGPH